MHSEDRTIHFSTELIHQPVKHKTAALQRLYYELSQIRGAGYDNTDFNVPQQPKFYSRRGSRTHSILVFLPDRLLLVEEWADMPLSGFAEKVANVGAKALEVLELPQFNVQSATIRTTCALSHGSDARAFLVENVFKQEGKIGPFIRRPLSVAGLRLVLPETDEHRGTFHVVIEPFRQEPSEVFVEVKGVYKNVNLNGGNMETAAENLSAVREFVTGQIYPYLNQFDTGEG